MDAWIEYRGYGEDGRCYECGATTKCEDADDILINIRMRDNGAKIVLCHSCFMELQDMVELRIMEFEKDNETNNEELEKLNENGEPITS
jgi:hypothetical protein